MKKEIVNSSSDLGLKEISNDEWEVLQQLKDLLEILEGTTAKLCGEKYATSSLIIPLTQLALNKLEKLTLTSEPQVSLVSLFCLTFSVLIFFFYRCKQT